MTRSGARRTALLLAALLAGLGLVACSGDDDDDGMAPPSSTTPGGPGTAAPVDATAPAPSCPNPEGGRCLGPLTAGTSYTTVVFGPAITYQVPVDGWANYEDIPGNFLLVPPGNDLDGVNAGTSDFIGVYTAVSPSEITDPDGCVTALVPGAGDSPRAMARWFRSRPNLTASKPKPVSVGGLSGLSIDLRTRPGAALDHCQADGQSIDLAGLFSAVPPSSLDHAVIPGMTMRLLLLGYDDKVLAVEIDDIDAAPGDLAQLTEVAGQLRFETGGATIAYSSRLSGGGADTYTAAPDGSAPARLDLPLPNEDFGRAVWSHDGSRLLYSNIPYDNPETQRFGFRPALSGPAGEDFTVLELPDQPEDMFCGAWTPDDSGVLCAIAADRPGLFVVSLDGSAVDRLTTTDPGTDDYPVGYSPDGSRVAFLRIDHAAEASPDLNAAVLMIAAADGTGERSLTAPGDLLGHELAAGAWLPDGTGILTATPEGRLAVASVADGSLTPLALAGDVFAALPSVAPDGAGIAFAGRTDSWDIYTADLTGGDLHRLVGTPADELAPSYGG